MNSRNKTDDRRPIEKLLEVVRTLRGEGGCPWDREQTLESLRPHLIEECYEVLDALDSGDPACHKEELGDVLLQIALHAQIRSEEESFSFDDVVTGITEKLIRRHPHVFADVQVSGAKDVLKNWEDIKLREKKGGGCSVTDGIPRHLPSLQKAQQVQSRVARVGFDWSETADVLAKIDEELGEAREAIEVDDQAGIEEELGDLLFSVVNLCRFRNLNAEEILGRTIDKFVGRFCELEDRIRNQGRKLTDCSLTEMDACWEAIKNEDRNCRTFVESTSEERSVEQRSTS